MFHSFQKSREKEYTPKINKALQAQVQQFINAKEFGHADSAALKHISSDRLYTVIKDLYLDAGIVYGAKHLAYLKRQKARMPIGFNKLMTELMNEYFRIDLLNLVEDLTTFTRQKIQEVLTDAYAIGSSYSEIVKELVSDTFTKARARLIARTETVTASNQGAMFAVKTTGLKLNKVWISAQDNRTRRHPRDKFDHLDMDGKLIGYEDAFNVDGEILQQPGDRKHGATAGNICNCRCAIGFEPVRENGKLVYVGERQVAA